MELIKERMLDAVEVYKRARIDRKLFSKIKTHREYIPSKKTILALALAMCLSLAETIALLEKGGFCLSSAILFDVIVTYFIKHEKYDFDEINSALYSYGQQIF